MMAHRTICQFLGIKVEEGNPFIITYNGRVVYHESSNGYWYKEEYDDKGNQTYYEDSEGSWWRKEYDSNGNETYFDNSSGYWLMREYDDDGNLIYHENSKGYIIDYRPMELTMDEIAEKFNISVDQLKIKK